MNTKMKIALYAFDGIVLFLGYFLSIIVAAVVLCFGGVFDAIVTIICNLVYYFLLMRHIFKA